jgi:DNA (cytosine-5)-methyltransferase 1
VRYFSAFAGIGGFEIGIQNAYREAIRRSEKDTSGDNVTRKRLVATEGKGLGSEDGLLGTGATDLLNERPLCIGYSEIDKWATKVYEYHFKHEKTKEEINAHLDSIKSIFKDENYDLLKICYVNTAKSEQTFIKTTNLSANDALESIKYSGVLPILKSAGRWGENIMLCEEKKCLICTAENVHVVQNEKLSSSLLNTEIKMDTLNENNMELAICINSPSKNTDLTDMKSSATTVITLKEGTAYAHTKRTEPVKNWGDITKINADDLPDFDCLVGGFPCQAFSIAGLRRGFEDTRGTLFFDLARILQAKRPRLFVFENVKGLLSHDSGNTFRTIIASVAELGYDCQWQVLNSKDFGVPQNRERVIIVGHLRGTPRPQVFPIGDTEEVHVDSHVGEEGVREITSTQTARQYANWNGNFVKELTGNNRQTDRVYDDEGIAPSLNTMQGGRQHPKVVYKYRKEGGEGYMETPHVSAIKASNQANQRSDGTSLVLEDAAIRRLTPLECERLQGFPDDWTKYGKDNKGATVPISDSQRYKMCGNAVTTNVIQAVFERVFSNKVNK